MGPQSPRAKTRLNIGLQCETHTEKLKTIRERLGITPDQLAPFVGARTGGEIQKLYLAF
jgi:hypothetical protein